MLQECPHCHLEVLASAQGVCPNCRKNVLDETGARPDLARLRVKERVLMPPCCHQCGAHTERRVKVHMNSGGDGIGNPVLRFLAYTGAVLFGGLLLLVHLNSSPGRARQTVTIHIPQCESCARAGTPRPIDVEFDQLAMTFLVHVRFKEAYARG